MHVSSSDPTRFRRYTKFNLTKKGMHGARLRTALFNLIPARIFWLVSALQMAFRARLQFRCVFTLTRSARYILVEVTATTGFIQTKSS